MKKYLIPIFLCLLLSSCGVYKEEVEEAERVCESHGGYKYISSTGLANTVGDVLCENGLTIKEHSLKRK